MIVDVVIESKSVGYIDDPPKRSNWTFSTTTGSLWDIPEGTEIPLADITCDVCHECSPRIVAIYRNFDDGTHFIRFQQLCHSADIRRNTTTTLHSPPADPMTDPPAVMEDRDHDEAEGMPELVTIPDDEGSLVDAEPVKGGALHNFKAYKVWHTSSWSAHLMQTVLLQLNKQTKRQMIRR